MINKSNRRLNREAITRARLERPKGWVPPNAMVVVDPNALGPAVKLRWIRKYFTKSEEDIGSFSKRMTRGWIPVTLAELPDLKRLSDPDGNIASNGCILCKIDAKTAQLDVEFYEDQAIGNLEGSSSDFLNEDAKGAIPKFQKGSKSSFTGRLPSA